MKHHWQNFVTAVQLSHSYHKEHFLELNVLSFPKQSQNFLQCHSIRMSHQLVVAVRKGQHIILGVPIFVFSVLCLSKSYLPHPNYSIIFRGMFLAISAAVQLFAPDHQIGQLKTEIRQHRSWSPASCPHHRQN